MKAGLLSFVVLFAAVFPTFGQGFTNASDTGKVVSLDSAKVSVHDSTKNVAIDAPKIIYVKVKPPNAISKEFSAGFRLNTDGWSVFFDLGKQINIDAKKSDMFHNVKLLEFEISEKKDPKEKKVQSAANSGSTGSTSYIYGKMNNFYSVKLGAGFRKMIAGKPDVGCASIHWATTLGPAIGLVKPYYLNVYGESDAIKYTTVTQGDFLDQNLIEGKAGFSKGLSEMKFVMGGFVKSCLHFDFSTNKRNVIAIETGINAEFYSQQVQILANQPGHNSFIDLFLSFQFGRRW